MIKREEGKEKDKMIGEKRDKKIGDKDERYLLDVGLLKEGIEAECTHAHRGNAHDANQGKDLK